MRNASLTHLAPASPLDSETPWTEKFYMQQCIDHRCIHFDLLRYVSIQFICSQTEPWRTLSVLTPGLSVYRRIRKDQLSEREILQQCTDHQMHSFRFTPLRFNIIPLFPDCEPWRTLSVLTPGLSVYRRIRKDQFSEREILQQCTDHQMHSF